MTDIVLRMKALPDLTNEKAWEVVYEGAREIERLRMALYWYGGNANGVAEMDFHRRGELFRKSLQPQT